MQKLMPFLWISLGGVLGANMRYIVARWSAQLLGIGFPYGTFIINVSGAFLLGFINTLIAQRVLAYPQQLRLAVCIGFLGSYTTFSTFEYESHQLIDDGEWMRALANLAGSLLAGLVAVHLGILLARKLA